jgi:hypothetical protein
LARTPLKNGQGVHGSGRSGRQAASVRKDTASKLSQDPQNLGGFPERMGMTQMLSRCAMPGKYL